MTVMIMTVVIMSAMIMIAAIRSVVLMTVVVMKADYDSSDRDSRDYDIRHYVSLMQRKIARTVPCCQSERHYWDSTWKLRTVAAKFSWQAIQHSNRMKDRLTQNSTFNIGNCAHPPITERDEMKSNKANYIHSNAGNRLNRAFYRSTQCHLVLRSKACEEEARLRAQRGSRNSLLAQGPVAEWWYCLVTWLVS